MCYEDFLFPPETPLFPPAVTVEKYLSDYTAHFALAPHIRLQTLVKSVDWLPDSQKWKVQVESKGLIEEPLYDLLIVANGHNHYPNIPKWNGTDEWLANTPKGTPQREIIHSIYYLRPERYTNRTVVIVGAGASGRDAALQVGKTARVVSASQPYATPKSSKIHLTGVPIPNAPKRADPRGERRPQAPYRILQQHVRRLPDCHPPSISSIPYINWRKLCLRFPGSWIHRMSYRFVVCHDFR